jgi:hypothetical protein
MRSNKTRKNYKKNTARGPAKSRPLGKSLRLPPIKMSSRIESTTVPQRTQKRVQINTPENELYEYSLGTSEREWKKNKRIKGIPKCRNPPFRSEFPCKLKQTIFSNLRDYEQYLQLKEDKNYSTGYKSKQQHYDDIESMLMWKGSDFLRK